MTRLLAVLLLIATAAITSAQVPSLMSYQGYLTDSSGTPIGKGTPINKTLSFKFYTVSTSGTPVYAESQVVTLSEGNFSVLLGNGTGISGLKGRASPAATPYIDLFTVMTGTLYLGVTVDTGAEIAPRQQIVSAAYAIRAKVAETLIDNSVTNTALATSVVTTAKILDANVTLDKLANNSVNKDKLADNAVNSAKISDGTVGNLDLADSAVNSAKISDGTIGTIDLADKAVDSAKILDGSIASIDIGDGLVTSTDIADTTISSADIGDGQVNNAELATNAVTSVKIADSAVTLSKLEASTQNALCPPGSIMPYAGDTAPAGWLLCNGDAYKRTSYSALHTVIGVRFGTSASDDFRVPDLRGQFLRGRDAGANRDPDRLSRSAMNPGGAINDAVGSIQGEAFKSHRHTVPTDNFGGSNADQNSLTSTGGNDEGFSLTPGTGSEGGNETRPMNAYVNYIIKI